VSLFFYKRILLLTVQGAETYYQPQLAKDNKVDPCLRPNQPLEIGYGNGGVSAFQYTLDETKGQAVDVGFVKVLITTDYVDLPNMEQETPFRDSVRKVALGIMPPRPEPKIEWDILFSVVQSISK
jgi:hypothetical protein